MKLYHGTAGRHLPKILKDGIKPRGKRKSNWDKAPSHPKAIYLTNAYAIYYALHAANDAEDLAVLEIDTDKLRPFDFAPDEDFLEQALRGRDEIAGDMCKRTTIYRSRLIRYLDEIEGSTPAATSLNHLGNCTYFGTIQPNAIMRYAVIKMAEVDSSLLWQAMDPSIVLMNYRICGAKYRNMVKWLFEEELEPELMDGFGFKPPEHRKGIEVKEVTRGEQTS